MYDDIRNRSIIPKCYPDVVASVLRAEIASERFASYSIKFVSHPLNIMKMLKGWSRFPHCYIFFFIALWTFPWTTITLETIRPNYADICQPWIYWTTQRTIASTSSYASVIQYAGTIKVKRVCLTILSNEINS